MHPVEDIRGSGDNLDCRQVELSTNVTLARSRCVSNYYITPVTGNSVQLERRCWNENHVPGSRLSSPGERERNAAMTRRVGVNMLQLCSVSNSPLTQQYLSWPFRTLSIKWEVYFSKELCPLVFIVLNMFLHASAYEYVTEVPSLKCVTGFFGSDQSRYSLGLDQQRWVEILDTTRCAMCRGRSV